ncbi:hypothetical protein DSM07_10390 [Oenococcus sp. UCMA 16435]|nr:hypothetical protein [Oenococcus sp. UCMA 14587]QHW12474.1 hypothetical protein DSM07_10390 [Oenococcus sp. UCMA 16435]
MQKETNVSSSLKVTALLGAATMLFSFFVSLLLHLNTTTTAVLYSIFNTYSSIVVALSVAVACTGCRHYWIRNCCGNHVRC